jgi:WD40 repeat protein
VATAGLDACVKIWNTENGELLKTLEGPGEGLDVRLSLSLSFLPTRPNVSSFNPPSFQWLMWHQRGNVLLAGSGDGTAWMWLASSGTVTAPPLRSLVLPLAISSLVPTTWAVCGGACACACAVVRR